MTPNSRSYLNRWLQPDSIIPDPYNPLAYDRYSYVYNNPVNATDRTGHTACWDEHANDPGCKGYTPTGNGLVSKIASGGNSNPPSNDFSDWFSDKYSGCFKCHVAVANGQIALTNEQLSEIHQKMQKLMALGYSPMIALTMILGTADVAPVVLQAIVSGEAADCATDGDCAVTRGIVVLGKYPKYMQVATDIEGKVFSVPTDKWNALTADQQWELNRGFLDQAVTSGDYFFLASKWSAATGWYGRELQYLFSLGYTISPNQVWLIPPG